LNPEVRGLQPRSVPDRPAELEVVLAGLSGGARW